MSTASVLERYCQSSAPLTAGDYAGHVIGIGACDFPSDVPFCNAGADQRRPAAAGERTGHVAAGDAGGCC